MNANIELSKQEYRLKFEQIALNHQLEFHIPASITLAQGILESNSGNSVLAKKANNHFGIKCHANWNGEKIYMDDDAANECFRSYSSAEESYQDHSEFLKNGKRYQFLFSYSVDDYKNWAYGLKKVGYATNPEYAELLIKIIEELNLNKSGDSKKLVSSNKPNLSIEIQTHSNDVNFIVVKQDDSFYQIALKSGLTLRQLHKYNDFDRKKETLKAGDIVYLEPKRNRSRSKKEIIIQKPMTLREVSQQEAIRLKPLMRKNQSSSPDEQLPKGEKVFLR
ncbi:MAG: glycoside hydrolase family 73 protein [Crocinitomicaceae bacterium]